MNHATSNQIITESETKLKVTISPAQMNLIMAGYKKRHTLPLYPQPNINGVAKEWKGKYYATGVLDMFNCILLEVGIRSGKVVTITDGLRNQSVIVINAKIDKLHLIEEREAMAEGVEKLSKTIWRDYSIQESDPETKLPLRNGYIDTARLSFFTLWIATHGTSSYQANPYVLSFNYKVYTHAE
jgi:hypothetical protein